LTAREEKIKDEMLRKMSKKGSKQKLRPIEELVNITLQSNGFLKQSAKSLSRLS